MIGQAVLIAAVVSSLLSGLGVWWIQSSRVDAAKARTELADGRADRLSDMLADRDTVIARQSRDIADLTTGVSQCALSVDTAKEDADRRTEATQRAMEELAKAQESAREQMARLESKLAKKPTGSCDQAIADWRAGR